MPHGDGVGTGGNAPCHATRIVVAVPSSSAAKLRRFGRAWTWLVLGISAALAVAATLIADHVLQQSRLPPRPLVGRAAPDFTLPDVQSGEPLSLSSFQGKPLVLIFGSYDCDV